MFNLNVQFNIAQQGGLHGIGLMILSILNSLIPILIGLAVILFVYGLIRYVTTDNQDTKKEAIRVIVYGIVALFVMVSIWGLVGVLQYTFQVPTMRIQTIRP